MTKSFAAKMITLGDDVFHSGAKFDNDRRRRYRYKLWRRWHQDLPSVAYLMLNPSRADADFNDQTINTCMRLARNNGYGGIEVVNLFAFCATDPRELKLAKRPVGTLNDAYISETAARCGDVIVAWGNHGNHLDRNTEVLDLLKKVDCRILCLGVNQNGEPRHPLYLPLHVPIIEFE